MKDKTGTDSRKNRLLSSDLVKAEAQLKQLDQKARAAKRAFKQAKKGVKQAKKDAKRAHKEFKALSRKAAKAGKRLKKNPRTKTSRAKEVGAAPTGTTA